MIGRRFGKLSVKNKLRIDGCIYWVCRCDCGNEKTIRTGHLNAGQYKSCGCVTFHGHGGEKTREYISYHNMIARCHKPKNKRYSDYGGKGIRVCERWRGDFKKFLDDMGLCPEGYQLDRIDNEKGYCPDNCRWVDRKTNMRNRRGTYRWHVRGTWYESSSDAAKANGVSAHTITAWCVGRFADGRRYDPKPDCWRVERYAH